MRVAAALDLPCVTGIKGIEVDGGGVVARREAAGGWEVFEVPLPAVISVKEGINLPRFPSLPGRLRAKKAELETHTPERRAPGLEKVRLVVPVEEPSAVEILGNGPEAAPRVVEVLRELGVVS